MKPLEEAIQLFVPVRMIYANTSKQVKRHPRHIRRALVKKRHLWRLYRMNRTLENKSIYYKQAIYVQKLIYDHNKHVEQSVINKKNLGSSYRFVNGKLSCKSGVGPLKAKSGELIVDDYRPHFLF